MTTVVILILGGAAVLILSALESNPDGSDVSVIQTVKDVWDDKLNFAQGNTPAPASTNYNSTIFTNAAATSQIQAHNF